MGVDEGKKKKRKETKSRNDGKERGRQGKKEIKQETMKTSMPMNAAIQKTIIIDERAIADCFLASWLESNVISALII